MHKQHKPLSQLDPDQIVRYSYDDENRAQRVILVNEDGSGTMPLEVAQQVVQQAPAQLVTVEVPIIVKETEIKIVEVPTIITQERVVKVETEKTIIQTELRVIEVPVIVKEIEFKEIEKTVFIEKSVIQTIPLWLKVCIVVHTFSFMGILIYLIRR